MTPPAIEEPGSLEQSTAEDIIRWAVGAIPRLAATSSFGADAAALLHLLSRVAPEVPVLFLDTGYHFRETLAHRRRLAGLLGLQVIDVHPQRPVAEQDARFGRDLFASDADACCRMRKTEPLDRALRDFDGWLTGVRRTQTPDRAHTPIVQVQQRGGRAIAKVAPLATWSEEDVDAYHERHGLPRHPLLAAGYRSIGCAPCSAAVAEGEDARAGRWAGTEKRECGLQFASPG